jgi:hypothetical protein
VVEAIAAVGVVDIPPEGPEAEAILPAAAVVIPPEVTAIAKKRDGLATD